MPDDDDISLEPHGEVSAETEAEATLVAQSLVAAFGHAWDRHSLPPLDEERHAIDLPDPVTAIATLADTTMLSGPVKLELLAELVRGDTPTNEVVPLARSLVRPDAAPPLLDLTTRELLERVGHSTPGQDPIGRTAEVLFGADDLVPKLVDDVQNLVLAFDLPDCDAQLVAFGSTPALSIATTAWSKRRLADFDHVIDPHNWPLCPLQHVFFRSITDISPKIELQAPDSGWRRTLEEVVDFSFGLGWASFTTDLDVVYFHDAARIGCTYDRHTPGGDGQISVDQGYLLAEAFGDWIRVRTLKQVHFVGGNLPSAFVCPFWGPATSAIAWACLPKENNP